jgi:hypothetical protein
MVLLAQLFKNEDDFFKLLPFILVIFCLGAALRPKDTYPIYISRKVKNNFHFLLRLLRLNQKMNNTFSYFSKYYFLIVLTIGLLPTYYLVIYPNIPQELGGVKPKKCLLLFDKDKIDNKFLFSNSFDSVEQNKLRVSDTLLVYYCGDSKCIVKKDKWDKHTYEIERKNINALVWINE